MKKLNGFLNWPRWAGLLAMMFFFHNQAAFAELSIHVSPQQVRLGETLRLTLTLDDENNQGTPNLAPLQKDFKITGTERSSSYTIINGQRYSMKQWTVLLIPKKSGKLTIPVLQVGNAKTTERQVEVTEEVNRVQEAITDTGEEAVKLKTELSTNSPYLNQEVIYTVKFYNSERLMDAAYTPPKIQDGILIPLGESARYQTVENGRNYIVEEQRYAIFPQKSGVLKITGPALQALVYDAIPRKVYLRPKLESLSVQPVPGSYHGKYWIPAKELTLSEEYEGLQTSLTQGATITRIITLNATGLPAELIPALEFESTDSITAYPEKPQANNTIKQQSLNGEVRVKVTYLINKSGQVTIPELKIHWFNTEKKQEEMATLAPRTFTVIGDPTPSLNKANPLPDKKEVSTPPKTTLPSQAFTFLSWWLAALFALAWLSTLLLWWFRPTAFITGKKNNALKHLRKACEEHNPIAAKDALIHWARSIWPNEKIHHLHDISSLIHSLSLRKELDILSNALYREQKSSWNGNELWGKVIEFNKKTNNKKHQRTKLPPINPS